METGSGQNWEKYGQPLNILSLEQDEATDKIQGRLFENGLYY